MPEQEHPILAAADDAREIAASMLEFFSPGRYNDAGVDWPRDLTRSELATLVPELRRVLADLTLVIDQVVEDNHGDPGKTRLVTGGVHLMLRGEERVRAGETLFDAPASQPASRAPQQVADSFPQRPVAGPAGASTVAPAAGRAVAPRPGEGRRPGARPC